MVSGSIATGAAYYMLSSAFVQVAPPTTAPPALRGSSQQSFDQQQTGMGGSAVSIAAVGAVAALAGSRVQRRAEPLSVAAVATVAKAATAKAATKTVGAVAGAAAVGGLAQEGSVAGTDKPSSQFDPAKQIGVTAPLGYFDPAGFCKKGDENGFRNLRAAELKHGRVAMMAALGAVVQHYVKFPGFENVPSGLAAVNENPGSDGMVALFIAAGLLELGVWTESASKEPGNFGDPFSFNQYNEDMRNRELNNGRMAMFAAVGILAAELLTGKDGIQQFGLA